MKALILAAGRGTRMGNMTEDLPKPMIPVAGKPILERILIGLKRAGVEDFGLITGYKSEVVQGYFGDGRDRGVRIEYFQQTELDGTAKALLLGKEAIGGSDFFLSWGDILVDPSNYPMMREKFEAGGVDAVEAVNEMEDPYRGSSVVFDEAGIVQRIIEKPPKGTAPSPYNGSGIFCFHPAVFEFAERVPISPRGEYELPQALQMMIEAGKKIRAHPIEGYWGDVGTPEDWERMNELLANDE
ncbi:MAG: NTP transferase domain-containing protein [Candidatus Omnitrophica bacterium]|nr:NTP transferase domain-containing protein [Candidatus Omnitrophota bacterium]